MKCTECGNQGKIVRRGMTFMGDIFRCSCRQIFTREQSIMKEEERIDAAFREALAFEESNRVQEVDFEGDDIGDDPVTNGWVGRNGLP